MATYRRVRAIDQAFLHLEERRYPMHFSLSMILEDALPRLSSGELNIQKIRNHVEIAISYYPLFRRKIDWVPAQHQAVWHDDPDFSIDHHIRHIRLPSPSTKDTFRTFSADLVSRSLPRNAPLWDMWIVEGLLETNTIGIIARVHHAMMDGIGALSVLDKIFRVEASDFFDGSDSCRHWQPAPAPTKTTLFFEGISTQYAALSSLASRLALRASNASRASANVADNGNKNNRSLGHSTKQTALRRIIQRFERDYSKTSQTSLNAPELSPHRSLRWHKLRIDTVKDIARTHNASVNDVLLAIITLGLRNYFIEQDELRHIKNFRALSPLSIRQSSESNTLSNRLGILLVTLPLHRSNFAEMLSEISRQTRAKKEKQRQEAQSFEKDFQPMLNGNLIAKTVRTICAMQPYNLVVTNVPGPIEQRFLGQSVLRHCFPTVPLYKGASIGIAIFSYNAELSISIVADPRSIARHECLYENFKHAIGTVPNINSWAQNTKRATCVE